MMMQRELQILSLAVALGAAGCASDGDGDGYNSDVDCNDEDATVYPGADEVAGDGIDSDCDGADDPADTGDDDDDTAGSNDPAVFDATEPVTGDWSCAGGTGQAPPPAGATGALEALVEDFEEEDPVASAQVLFWGDNDIASGQGSAAAYESDADGMISTADDPTLITACSPFAVKVWTEFDPPETYPTYEMGMIVAGDAPFQRTLNSVAYSTYNLLPLTVGVEAEPGKSIAAGRIRDCNDEPVANAEASVGTLDLDTGEVVEVASQMRFFKDESPDGSQMFTSDDGLFGAMNVETGSTLNLLIWGIPQQEAHCRTTNGGDVIWSEHNSAMCLLGFSEVYVQPDSVNIANVYLKNYPDSCYAQ